MSDQPDLIPPPPVVRDRLAKTLRQTRLLRSLLRLSVRAAEERREFGRTEISARTESQGVSE